MRNKLLGLTLGLAISLGGCAEFQTDLQNANTQLAGAAKTATTIAPTAAQTASQAVSGGLSAGAAIIDGVIGLINVITLFT